jgi:hypothetical protein
MKPMHALAWAAAALIVAVIHASSAASGAAVPQVKEPFPGILDEHPAIRYAERPARDRVARLSSAIAQGTAALSYERSGGYLHSLLRALDISPDSQLLVFSKTGVQRAATSPRNPRALYFNDRAVVGYIPGARYIEIAAQDPEQGIVFYTVDQMVTSAPAIERQTACLTCHVSGSTLDVPGVITRSNFTDADGNVIAPLGFHLVDHRTPVTQRWGGWFVTGKYDLAPYGGVTHLGNVATVMHPAREAAAGTSNEIFMRWFDTDIATLGYASHESDIAALMVFDHQARAMNLLTRLNWESRVAAYSGAVDFTRGDLQALVQDLVDYFLFVGEAAPPARLTPRAEFAARLTAVAPKDSRGRSFGELELTSRLLKYPCSFMIYTEAFDHLPTAARQAVYRGITEVLAGEVNTTEYAHLSPADRRAILEILQETKSDWPRSK